MKKRYFILFLMLLFVIRASAVHYECSNGTEMKTGNEEIKLGYAKSILGFGIGVVYSREVPAVDRVEAEIILEAKRITLDNSQPKETIRFFDKEIEVELVDVEEENTTLKIDGTTDSFEKREYKKSGGYDVYVSEAYPDLNKTEFVIGNKKIYLSNDNYPNYKLKINNDTFLISILSASSESAVMGINKCSYSDILEIGDNSTILVENITSNQNTTLNTTLNTNLSNSNITINTTHINANASTNANNNENKKDIGSSCVSNDNCISNLCHSNKCVKRYWFDSIIEWFKNLF